MSNTHETARSTEASLRAAITEARQELKDLRTEIRRAEQVFQAKLVDGAIAQQVNDRLTELLPEIQRQLMERMEVAERKIDGRFADAAREVDELLKTLEKGVKQGSLFRKGDVEKFIEDTLIRVLRVKVPEGLAVQAIEPIPVSKTKKKRIKPRGKK